MLPPEVGIPTIRRELTAGATRGEVVVAGRLGVMAEERAERGGIDPARFDTATTGPMVGGVAAMGVHGASSSRPRSTPRSSRSSATTRSRARRCCRA